MHLLLGQKHSFLEKHLSALLHERGSVVNYVHIVRMRVDR